MMDLKMKLMCL